MKLPSEEEIIKKAMEYADTWDDDPHAIAEEAFIGGCNYILSIIRGYEFVVEKPNLSESEKKEIEEQIKKHFTGCNNYNYIFKK